MGPPSRARRGFTLVELLIAIGVILVISSLLLTGLAAARERARAATCLSNLRQAAQALRMYAEDSDGTLPGTFVWDRAISETLHLGSPFWCPDVQHYRYYPNVKPFPGTWLAGYAYNGYLAGSVRPVGEREVPMTLSQIHFPATTVAICEASVNMISLSGPNVGESGPDAEEGGRRHWGGSNYAFVDGHLKWYRPEQVGGGAHLWHPDGARPTFLPW